MSEGTTKNAHTQEKRTTYVKKDRYLSHSLFNTRSSSIESEVLIVDDWV